MANLVAYLNARPISTRFHIRVATVRAVQVMREPTGINLPEGARPTSTVKLAHLGRRGLGMAVKRQQETFEPMTLGHPLPRVPRSARLTASLDGATTARPLARPAAGRDARAALLADGLHTLRMIGTDVRPDWGPHVKKARKGCRPSRSCRQLAAISRTQRRAQASSRCLSA
jgi:hypothetical protein